MVLRGGLGGALLVCFVFGRESGGRGTGELWAQASPVTAVTTAGASLSGQVVDARGRAVDGATVTLRVGDGDERKTVTDGSGGFRFAGLRVGRYRLRAERPGGGGGELAGTLPGEPVRLVLPPAAETAGAAAGQEMEFSDKPNFSVAGVTDWTAVGGHGSDATLRTSEDLVREAVTLTTGEVGSGTGGGSRDEARLRATVAADPRDYTANHDLGELYLRSARYGEAVPLLKAASALHHGMAEDEFALALACRGVGDVAQAREHVDRALAGKNAAEFHRLSGELAEQAGDPLTAVRQEEQAARMDPSEENEFAWGSELLLHRAIWQAAEVFGRGARAHPGSARLKTGLGAALFAGARYAEAAASLCGASDLDPANVESYRFMGRVGLASPSAPPCLAERLERRAELRPEDAEANYFAAMLLLKNGSAADRGRAEAMLRRAVTADPRYAEAYLELGVLAFGDKRYAEAIAMYGKAVEADPRQAEARYRLGVAFDRTGRRDEARREFAEHDRLVAVEAEAVEGQRREVKEFLVVLGGEPAGAPSP